MQSSQCRLDELVRYYLKERKEMKLTSTLNIYFCNRFDLEIVNNFRADLDDGINKSDRCKYVVNVMENEKNRIYDRHSKDRLLATSRF